MTAAAVPKRPRGRPPRNPTHYTTGEGYHDPWMNARSPALDGSCDLAEPKTSGRASICEGPVLPASGGAWSLCRVHRALLWQCVDGTPRVKAARPVVRAGDLGGITATERERMILDAVRRPSCLCVAQAAKTLGVSRTRVDEALEVLGCREAVVRMYRARRRRNRRRALLKQLRSLARALGRTPGIRDVNAGALERRCGSADNYRRYFGGLLEAQRQAGLAPNRHAG